MGKVKRVEVAPFDASEYLDNEEVIAQYLGAALDDPNPEAFLVAVQDVAKAKGKTEIAATTGLGRESLYKALRLGAQPRFNTVRIVLRALGVQLHVKSSPRKSRTR